jgi:hypothetical protein
MTELEKIRKLLTDDKFPGSKDWAQSDLAGRVEWLLEMYDCAKQEIDCLGYQIYKESE